MVAVVVLAVALFALPLGALVWRDFREQQSAALEEEATRVIALVPDDSLRPGEPLPAPRTEGVVLGLYDAQGNRLTGAGPDRAPEALTAQTAGVARTTVQDNEMAVYTPFRADGRTPVTVRAAIPLTDVDARIHLAWVLLGLLAAAVVAVTAAVAAVRARRLSRPFEQLAAAARDLGEGAFALRVAPTGVTEGEDVARALESSARRLGERLDREQRFAADASHQLRTPLTAMRLSLEAALVGPDGDLDSAAREALAQADRLERTIDDLLGLTRYTPDQVSRCDVAGELADAYSRWTPLAEARGRALTVVAETGLPPVAAPESAVRQILDVLIDNALRHGAGPVVVRARDVAGSVAIDVHDAGGVSPAVRDVLFVRGSSGAGGTGIGLSLARSLAQSHGGRLSLAAGGPGACFTLLLPSAEDHDCEPKELS